MTWLSRLLPQSPSLRLAGRSDRTRQAQRRRRMATLETLEGRTLLANVGAAVVGSTLYVIPTPSTTPVTYPSVSFSITENANGTVTLVGTPAPSSNPHAPPSNTTQINNQPVNTQVTTLLSPANIFVLLPGNSTTTSDIVSMTGTGRENVTIVVPGSSTTAGGANLTLNVTSLKNTQGTFSLYDAPTTGVGPNAQSPAFSPTVAASVWSFPTDTKGNQLNYLGGQLTANITGSQFSALTIEQDGCCQAGVTLTNDIVPGSVQVYEGTGNADSISVSGVAPADVFGATTLVQYYAPTVTMKPTYSAANLGWSCQGTGDTVSVNDMQIYSLAVTQGNGPLTDVGAISLPIVGTIPQGVNPYYVGQTIDIGNTSDVEVNVLGFGVTATQGSAPSDVIYIESITHWGSVGSKSHSYLKGLDSIVTLQGNGLEDSTTVDSSTVDGNISVTQGDGALDYVLIADDAAGLPGTDENGLLYVSQGNGYEDFVVVNSAGSETGALYPTANTFNNVWIAQGTSTITTGLTPAQCAEAGGDAVTFDEATVNDNLVILQNATATVNSDGTVSLESELGGLGNNYVGIGTFVPVTVGNSTYVYQGGADNTVYLGGASGVGSGLVDFETGTLDIWTGAGGGGFVTATNTAVDALSAFVGRSYVINGAGGNNTYVDGTGNTVMGAPDTLPYGPGYSG